MEQRPNRYRTSRPDIFPSGDCIPLVEGFAGPAPFQPNLKPFFVEFGFDCHGHPDPEVPVVRWDESQGVPDRLAIGVGAFSQSADGL